MFNMDGWWSFCVYKKVTSKVKYGRVPSKVAYVYSKVSEQVSDAISYYFAYGTIPVGQQIDLRVPFDVVIREVVSGRIYIFNPWQ